MRTLRTKVYGIATLCVLAVATARAADKPQLLIRAGTPEPVALTDELSMRPNVVNTVYFYVNNPTDKDGRYTVTVGGLAAEVVVPAKQRKQVSFAPPPAAPAPSPAPGSSPAGAPAAPAAAAKPAWIDLKDTPPTLAWQLSDANGVIDSGSLHFSRATVGMDVTKPDINFKTEEKGNKNLLSMVVTANRDFDPECVVQLVLPPERAKGLLTPLSRDACARGVLTKKGEKVTLFLKDLNLAPGDREAYIYLLVDGYRHAVYKTTFQQVGEVKPQQEAESYRVYPVPPLGSAPAGDKLVVHVEADGCPHEDSALEVAIGTYQEDASGSERFDRNVVKLLPGCYERKVRFAPGGPNGSLLFQLEIKDWVTEIETAGILGKRVLRVRPVDGNGKGETDIILDNTPPENVAFNEVPVTGFQGTKVTVKAFAQDPESNIRDAVFFFGKPPTDGKIPPTLDTVSGVPVPGVDNTWSAKLVLPSDKKGPGTIGVLFTNNAGLSTGAVTSVTVLDPRDPKAPAAPGKIEGKVFEGDRPQPGLEVALRDDKGKDQAKAKTDEKGAFVFDGVLPGKYSVATAKSASRTKGEASVEVVSEKTATVEVKLFR